jgi:flavin reductase (DIM6/NTAB) family NADH-FMN oxidoreductase RutF
MADSDLIRLAKVQLALPANAPVSLDCRLSGTSRVSDVVLI